MEMYKSGANYSEIARECKKISGHSYTRSAVSGKVSRLIRGKHMERIFHMKNVSPNIESIRRESGKRKEPKMTSSIDGAIAEIKKEEKRRAKSTTGLGFRFDRAAGSSSQPPLRYPNRPAGPKAVILVDLKHGQCKSPVGDFVGADQLFCGNPASDGESYCPSCKEILYRPETKSDRVYVSKKHLGL